eukprot:3226132-Pyramimonas_sp.AAC.1
MSAQSEAHRNKNVQEDQDATDGSADIVLVLDNAALPRLGDWLIAHGHQRAHILCTGWSTCGGWSRTILQGVEASLDAGEIGEAKLAKVLHSVVRPGSPVSNLAVTRGKSEPNVFYKKKDS